MSKSENTAAGRNILLILTGSIACYKACTVMSRLRQKGHHVKVVMSPSSLEFVGTATVEGLTGEPPVTDMYAPGSVMDHISLARWADLILAAPATANYINKIAHGLGDDLLTTLFLAHDFAKPFLLAPAMNTKMYQHPVTQESIQRLRGLGVEILETASGVLACGEIGSGRLLEPELITAEVEARLPQITAAATATFAGQAQTAPQELRVLITAGGTTEPIDDVRVITNRSSGRTAAALADFLMDCGLHVTYLHSRNAVLPQRAGPRVAFESFHDLQGALETLLRKDRFNYVIHAAAVSDYAVEKQPGKISSTAEEITLHLKRNPKLISEIKRLQPGTRLIGFKLTSGAAEPVIRDKVASLFAAAGCDYVVQNDWNDVAGGTPRYRLFRPGLEFTSLEGHEGLKLGIFQTILKETL